MAYIELNNRALPAEFACLLKLLSYQQVFVLDVITPFDMRAETGRNLSYQDALLENKKLTDVYQRFGHTVIQVPQLTIDERLEYILSRIN